MEKEKILQNLQSSYSRVLYKHNPIAQVVLQVRFPTLLRLDSEKPVQFQELIIGKYPFYEEQKSIRFRIDTISSEAPNMERASIAHNFVSKDRDITIGLTSSFISVSTTKYSEWQILRKEIEFALSNFFSCYPSARPLRIGLRYINTLPKSLLDSKRLDWTGAISRDLLGAQAVTFFEGFLFQQTQWAYRLALSDIGIVLQGGLSSNDDGSSTYSIDADYFTERQLAGELHETLDVTEELHSLSGPIFRWCITDELHHALHSE